MATQYQVYEKAKYEAGNSKPLNVFFVIDSAYDEVKQLSKNKSHTVKTYRYDPKKPWNEQGYEDVEVPDIYLVIEKGKLTVLRALGVNGKIVWPVDCKRCTNGVDVNDWQTPCRACNSGGYKIK